MRRSKRAVRRQILVELLNHLKTEYDFELSQEAVRGILDSTSGIDALVSFRSDPHLSELQGALARLDSGTFGTCLACKGRIPTVHLDNDVTRRVCPSCGSVTWQTPR